jgi:predicted ATPase
VLERIVVKGYKSIEEADIPLRPINVLIGANGSGKSNFVSLFRFMNSLVRQRMQTYVAQAGGADQILHYGRKTTERLHIKLWFSQDQALANGYECTLIPTAEDLLVLEEEAVYFHNRERFERPFLSRSSSQVHNETLLGEWKQMGDGVAYYVLNALNSWQLYHFHDTSESAKVKQTGDLHDNLFLRPDASNLAAYLYLLRETQEAYYRNIVETVRLAAPFFDDFVLRPSPFNPGKIRLEWQERDSDAIFGPHALSDGTLRFICLATLFLQPPDKLPSTIVLDEPELGLHPYAIALLADLIQSVAQERQVILATQSVTLVNQFTPEDILVVDRVRGKTVFRRLDQEQMAAWLEDYGLGDLWEKNLLGGRPGR